MVIGSNKADINHSHAWSTITGKPSSFTPVSHTHDDRYYTETEINNKLKSIVIVKSFTIALNKVTSLTEKTYTIDVSLSGYTPLIAIATDYGNVDNNIFYCGISGNKVNIAIKQGYTGNAAIQAHVGVMYLHN
ncbi:hypothetical protein [Clostridium sp. AF32-12BH]|uniref:hypothetical protein n=1 Tax=Clostridium sp. AF32-12BH TaxID=2292006 RepID=UPI000E495B9A|nr:hypothetical protein [Clostridium sp. AF32-12BH]RHP47081.1 hypothetical protein DWZ40_09270 [Clostridium sp. AF32-12BH]